MAKATSSHFVAALSGAEEHNERLKQLDYVRKDLSHLNQTWKAADFSTVDQARKEVAERYKAAHGRKLPKNSTPIQETVVVLSPDTTMKQLQDLARRIEETWGFRPLAIYTHLDEGHVKAWDKGKWIPNLHAHLIFDTTDSKGETLKPISEKMRKSQQSKWEKKEAELAQKEGREPRKFFVPDSWKKPAFDYMQDLTAECLGMERGVSSSKKHKDALQYKIEVLSGQVEELQGQKKILGEKNQEQQEIIDSWWQSTKVGAAKSVGTAAKAVSIAYNATANYASDLSGRTQNKIDKAVETARSEERAAVLATIQKESGKTFAELTPEGVAQFIKKQDTDITDERNIAKNREQAAEIAKLSTSKWRDIALEMWEGARAAIGTIGKYLSYKHLNISFSRDDVATIDNALIKAEDIAERKAWGKQLVDMAHADYPGYKDNDIRLERLQREVNAVAEGTHKHQELSQTKGLTR